MVMGTLGHGTLDSPAGTHLAPASAGPAALELRGVHKHYASRVVLTGVDLTVQPGRLVSITGPNGVGKTTLLRVAAGIIAPDLGEVAVCGVEPEHDGSAYRRRIAFVSAGDRGLYPRLSVRQNLEFAARLGLVERRRLEPAVDDAVERVGLGSLATQRVDRLSMGERQRVRIAAALMHDPDVVLLDEPENSLDDVGLRVLADTLAGVILRGGSVVSCGPSGVEDALPFDERYTMRDGMLEAA
jgi:ABC-type multidrug transport system ATPase subunit